MVLHYCHSVYSALKGRDDNKMKSGQSESSITVRENGSQINFIIGLLWNSYSLHFSLGLLRAVKIQAAQTKRCF